jgi:hypothetical protein
MLTQTQAVAALASRPDRALAEEPRLVELRSQAAIVRTLVDQVEQVTRAGDVASLGAQMVEEMARLGCRLLDTAAALAEVSVEDSGVFERSAALRTGHWKTPTYDLVRMDAEIGSYQEDNEPGREAPPLRRPATRDVQ